MEDVWDFVMIKRQPHIPGRTHGFTLVELLAVIGVIALLIAILIPTLNEARRQAKQVQCQSNMRQTGQLLLIYCENWRGYLFPPKRGAPHPPEERWPMFVFKPAVWNPPLLICPADPDPAEEHSYVLNNHLADKNIKYSSSNLGGLTPSDVIVMGEKYSGPDHPDYYMDKNDFGELVEPYRHGVKHGSNYLYMDMHVGLFRARDVKDTPGGLDPWDVPVPDPTQPSPG